MANPSAEVKVVKGHRQYYLSFQGNDLPVTSHHPTTGSAETHPHVNEPWNEQQKLQWSLETTASRHTSSQLSLLSAVFTFFFSDSCSLLFLCIVVFLCRHVSAKPETQHKEESEAPTTLCLHHRGGETDCSVERNNRQICYSPNERVPYSWPPIWNDFFSLH